MDTVPYFYTLYTSMISYFNPDIPHSIIRWLARDRDSSTDSSRRKSHQSSLEQFSDGQSYIIVEPCARALVRECKCCLLAPCHRVKRFGGGVGYDMFLADRNSLPTFSSFKKIENYLHESKRLRLCTRGLSVGLQSVHLKEVGVSYENFNNLWNPCKQNKTGFL